MSTVSEFSPVRIGVCPVGVEWVAYRPEYVERMRARLAAIWSKHAERLAEADTSSRSEWTGRRFRTRSGRVLLCLGSVSVDADICPAFIACDRHGVPFGRVFYGAWRCDHYPARSSAVYALSRGERIEFSAALD